MENIQVGVEVGSRDSKKHRSTRYLPLQILQHNILREKKRKVPLQPPLALSAALIKYCYWIKRLHLSILLPLMGVDVRGSTDGGRDGRPTVARSSSSQSVCGKKGTLPPSPDLCVERREREREIPSPLSSYPFLILLLHRLLLAGLTPSASYIHRPRFVAACN